MTEILVVMIFLLLALAAYLFYQLSKSKLQVAGLEKMEQTFKALASESLQKQSEIFLSLASERLDKKTVEARGLLEEKTATFNKLVEPIERALSQVQREMSAFEKSRSEQFGQISEQLKNVVNSSETLQKEAQSLSFALRRPEVRGSWGEIQLRRVVELAGMSAHCDFEEQVSVKTEKGYQRPDMLVRLPNDRVIAVDSKAVLSAYVESLETENADQRKILREKHAQNLRLRIRELSQKAYWEQFSNTPDFVVLFIPNEAFLEAAVEVDRALLESAWQENIIVATPTTLVALLKAIAYGWQQNEMTKNAEKIIEAAKEFYDRLLPWIEHMEKVGVRLEDAMKSYNDSIGSLETRVLPSTRKLKELGLKSDKEVPDLSPVTTSSRPIKKLT